MVTVMINGVEEHVPIFDAWEHVYCDQCEPYWTGACDGVPTGSERPCTSFKAIRVMDVPAQIKTLEKRSKKLRTLSIVSLVLSSVSLLLNTITLIGW